MLFAIIFTDKPSHGPLRTRHLQAHLAWVLANKDTILVAGSLRRDLPDVPLGALWIVEAASKESVLQLIETDPFYASGLRQSIEVLHWSEALPESRVLV